MASRSVNDAVARLRAMQRAQGRALRLVGRALADVSAVSERRSVVLAQLGADESAARAGLDVALVVLADVVGDGAAAALTVLSQAEVRAARRRADRGAVVALAAAVREGRSGSDSGVAEKEGGED